MRDVGVERLPLILPRSRLKATSAEKMEAVTKQNRGSDA
jgi:hypothetical protein